MTTPAPLPTLRPYRHKIAQASTGQWALRILGIAATFAAISAVIGGLWAASQNSAQIKYDALAAHGIRASAIVTRSLPRDHNSIFYTYKVGQVTYEEGGFSDPPNPSAFQLAIGDTVRIVYDARRPQVSCACDPVSLRQENRPWVYFGAPGALFSVLITPLLSWGLAKRRRWVTIQWSDLPIQLRTQAYPRWNPRLRKQRGTPGTLVIAPGHLCFYPQQIQDTSDGQTAGDGAPMIHTERQISVVKRGGYLLIQLQGNSSLGQSGVSHVGIPKGWRRDDYVTLFYAAGFDTI